MQTGRRRLVWTCFGFISFDLTPPFPTGKKCVCPPARAIPGSLRWQFCLNDKSSRCARQTCAIVQVLGIQESIPVVRIFSAESQPTTAFFPRANDRPLRIMRWKNERANRSLRMESLERWNASALNLRRDRGSMNR